MSKKPSGDDKKLTYRIPPDGPWANAWKVAAVFGGVGIAACALGMTSDPHRFAFSWLFAFMCFLALGLGGLFITLMLNITGASWGVTPRRTAELLAAGLPVFVLLWIPIGMSVDELYPWSTHHGAEHGEEHGDDAEHEEGAHEEGEGDEHGWLDLGAPTVAHAQDPRDRQDVRPSEWGELDHEHEHGEGAAHDHDPEHAIHGEVIEAKLTYLDRGFFFARAGIYFLAWILLALAFFRWSTRQSEFVESLDAGGHAFQGQARTRAGLIPLISEPFL
ncbi:MAG: hypothetical protein R3266_13145, partial [Gemmatimonadota bacterium]|nr:hypothetical protein [Gemmatimonadota bacterium]